MNSGEVGNATQKFSNIPWIKNDLVKQAVVFLLGAGLVALAVRVFYYAIFPWVLSFNLVFPPGVLTPWIEGWTAERDGIEIYVVYSLLFVCIGLSALFGFGLIFLSSRWRAVVLTVAALATLVHLGSLSFTPPSSQPSNLFWVVVFAALLALTIALRRWIPERLGMVLAVIILLPMCFIVTSGVAASNYAYIFAPTQKLLDGVPVQEIYFQYDFLISAIAALWFKLGLEPNLFQFVGAAANFVTILAIFLMARSLFETRALAYLMLAFIIIFRILAAPWDPLYVFQITPLRLDLWLALVLIVFFRGPRSLLIPFVCGAMLVVQGAFGIIYTLAYLQLMLTLAALEIFEAGWRTTLRGWLARPFIFRVLIIALYLGCCFLLSKYLFGLSMAATSLYQKIGIGFIPLFVRSFFWVAPIILSCLAASLFLLRNKASPAYIYVGIFSVYLFMGNSIYFLGRSHELNLFSIAIFSIFVIFYFFDAASRFLNLSADRNASNGKGRAALVAGAVLLVAVVWGCGGQIGSNLAVKLDLARQLKLSPSDSFADVQPSVDKILAEIDAHVGENARVQFLLVDETKEFLLYQGRQENKTFFYPFAASVFTADMIKNMRDLLMEGRYLLVDDKTLQTALAGGFSREDFGFETPIGEYTLIGKDSILK